MRLAAISLVAALLLLGCSGDDEAPASPTGTPTVDAFPTIERPPTPTATPEGAIVSIGAPEPLETSALDPLPEPEVLPYVYDVETSRVLDPGTPSYSDALKAMVTSVSYIDENRIAIRTPGAGLVQAQLQTTRLVAGPPRQPLAAAALNARVRLLDLESLTAREISLLGTPIEFSRDGSRLLLRNTPTSDPPRSGYIVVPLDNPSASARLPLGSAADYDSQHSARWLDATHVLTLTQNPERIQVIDTAGSEPDLIAEHELPAAPLTVSPDGGKIAIQIGGDLDSSVEVYNLDPFGLDVKLEGASLGQYYEVPSEVWTPDGSHLLVVLDFCKDAERLVSYDFGSGEYTELARGGFLYWVVSPDSRWVAYTAWAQEGWVVPSDGSSPAVRVADEVNAPSQPFWSGDSRYARFTPYFGGYDRCLA